MNQHCKTCRHWEKYDTTLFGGRHICLLTINAHEYEGAKHSLANVFDDEHTHSGLWTDADFGCIQHEPVGPGIGDDEGVA